MTSSRGFRRFALAYGPAFAVLYVVARAKDLALITVYPTLGIAVLGAQHSQELRRLWEVFLRCIGTAGLPQPRSGLACLALWPHFSRSDGRHVSGWGGCG